MIIIRNINDEAYTSLAEHIMFGSDKSLMGLQKEMDKLGLEFRKGKSINDINIALKKALHPKNGLCKVEYELSMLEVYLKHDVVKRKRK